ncbi:uncharacterized protein LOC144622508 isoform X2 [Crassostrea virginica]
MREGCTCGHGPMISNPTPRTVFFSRHKRKRGPLTEQNVYRIGNHIQKLTTSLLTKSARVSFYPDCDAIRHADKANLVFYDNKRQILLQFLNSPCRRVKGDSSAFNLRCYNINNKSTAFHKEKKTPKQYFSIYLRRFVSETHAMKSRYRRAVLSHHPRK